MAGRGATGRGVAGARLEHPSAQPAQRSRPPAGRSAPRFALALAVDAKRGFGAGLEALGSDLAAAGGADPVPTLGLALLGGLDLLGPLVQQLANRQVAGALLGRV